MRLQVGERILYLAAQTHRLLVDDENIRPEGFRRRTDDRLPHFQGLVQLDVTVQRGIFAVSELYDARDLHEVDARAIIEGAGDGRTGDDQDLQSAVIFHQCMGDGATTSEMAEPEGIVAVHEDAGILEAPCHTKNLSLKDRNVEVYCSDRLQPTAIPGLICRDRRRRATRLPGS